MILSRCEPEIYFPPVMGEISRSCSAVILLAIICLCRAVTLESTHWSSSNTKFSPGQGLVLYPQIGDKMDIVCPQAESSSGTKEEFYRVYLVSRRQMESCTVDNSGKPLLNCDKPHQDVKFTFKFQEFSPNLWGLEFLKGKDYYITSTSTGSLPGLDNTNGGVCRTKSMKLVLRVGQSSSDPPSRFQESPTRFPPTQPESKAKDPPGTDKDNMKNTGSDKGRTGSSRGPESGLFTWVVSGCAILSLVIIILLAVLWRHHRHRCVPERQQSATVPLSTLAVPKRDSISSDNNGSDRSGTVFPRRPSDSILCHHYERVSCDYGPPVFIVQEMTPQSPNIYYKV